MNVVSDRMRAARSPGPREGHFAQHDYLCEFGTHVNQNFSCFQKREKKLVLFMSTKRERDFFLQVLLDKRVSVVAAGEVSSDGREFCDCVVKRRSLRQSLFILLHDDHARTMKQ